MSDVLKNARIVFDEAAELSGADRARLLDERCGADTALREMVERLLAEHDRGLGAFLEQPAMTLPAGGGDNDDGSYLPARIGAYEIVRVVGQGGMGIVYEARQENPRRTVALKVIRPAMASGSMLKRFSQEATVLGQLQHPGIACIYEAGVADVTVASGATIKQPYFAMEFVRGEPLRAFSETRRLSPAARLELIARVCDAVQHAHQKGVIHRDLKPGNILVVDEATERRSVEATKGGNLGSQNVSGIDRMAEGNASGKGNIPSHLDHAGSGEIRINCANATGCGFNTLEHSGGSRSSKPGGLSEIPKGGTGFADGASDSGAAFRRSWVSEEPDPVVSVVGGNRSSAPRADSGFGETEQVSALGNRSKIRAASRVTTSLRRFVASSHSISSDLGGHPKILDFGVARVTDSDTTMVTQQTDVGQLIGTIPYMSPEQVAGDSSQIDTRSDVYALGVILYELLSGRLPHDVARRSIPEAARVIREEEPSRLSSINSAYRGDIDVIVTKAMEKDRERRYSSAAELAADIRRHLRDEPLVARAPSAMYRFRKFARRNRAIVGGTVAVFVALAAGLIVAVNFAVSEANQRRIAEQEKTKANRQRDLAEQRFEDVRQLARTMIFKLHDEIKDLPGTTPARKLIVDTGLIYLDTLAAQAGDNAVLLKDLAGSYKRLAAVQGDPTGANLGDMTGALETYRKSLDACEKLVTIDPENPDYAVGPTTILSCMANVQIGLGRQDDALASYEAALEIAEANCRRFPNHDVIEEDRAECAVNIARIHESAGRLDQALPLYTEFRDFVAARFKKDPGSATYAFNISFLESRIGSILNSLDRTREALPHFEESVRVARLVAQKVESPGANTSVQARLSDALIYLGRAYYWNDDFDKAFPPIREALEIRRKAAESDPRDLRARRGLAVAYEALGSAYSRQGRHEEALAEFETFRDLTAQICADHPDYSYSRHDLALAHNNIGKALFRMKKWERSIEPFRAAFQQLEGVVKAAPSQVASENDRVESSSYLALAYFSLFELKDRPANRRDDDLLQARDWARQCVELADHLRENKLLRGDVEDLVAKVQRASERCEAELRESGGGEASGSRSAIPAADPP